MKFILTLLITFAAAGLVHAQTAAPAAPAQPGQIQQLEAPEAPATPAEPATKKIAYEVKPAQRVATPAKDVTTRDDQPADLNELKKAQDRQRVEETIKQRQQVTSVPAQTPEKKEAAPAAPEAKPKQ